jgi:N-acetylglucosamine malate deacetylase 1
LLARLKRVLRTYLRTRAGYRFFVNSWLAPGDSRRSADILATMRHRRLLDPVQMAGPKQQRIVVIAPHPDDEVIGPGGTLVGALQKGARVRVIYLTNGDNNAEAAAQRRDEAREAASLLGYETEFLDFPNGAIPHDEPHLARLAEAIDGAIGRADAGCLFLPFVLDDHDDHRRASELVMALGAAGRLAPKTEIWAYQVYTVLPSNVVVDISAAAARKREAIGCFASQNAKRDWGHYALGLNAFNVRLLKTNGPAYAEAFFVLPLAEYVQLCTEYFADAPALCYLTDYYRSGRKAAADESSTS